MQTMRKTFLFVLSVICALSLSAQSRIDSLKKALDTVQGEQRVKTFNELFKAYINTDPVVAIEFTRDALSLALEITDERGMAASYNNLGVAYKNQGALDNALENYLLALQLYQKIGNKEGIASTKNNIGNIYSFKKDQEQARKYLEEANKLFIELNDEFRIIGTLNNLGNMYNDLQNYEEAMKYYEESLERSDKINLINSDPITNIGNLFLKQHMFEKALEFYNKALPVAEAENNQLGVLGIISSLGEACLHLRRLNEAQTHLTKALSMCQDLQAYVYEPSIYKNLAATYASQDYMDKAYEAMMRYDMAREKIYSEESSRRIAQMEMALDIKEKESQLEVLRIDTEMKTMELRQTQMIVALVCLAIVTVIGLISLFVQKKKFTSN
jgi:tetratricopeptide (TPR) repeat protein